MSPLTEKKKLKKAHKPIAKQTVTTVATVDDFSVAQPADHHPQGPAEARLEGSNDSAANIKSIVASPVRAPTPIQDPTPNMVQSPVRDPSPDKVPIRVMDSSPQQASIPVEDPNHKVNPIPVRSLSPLVMINNTLSSVQVEQDYKRFVQWKSYRVALFDVLCNWKIWKEEKKFILEVNGCDEILSLIQWENQLCQELILNHYLAKEQARLKEKAISDEKIPNSSSQKEEIQQVVSSPKPQQEQIAEESIQEEPLPSLQHDDVQTALPVTYEEVSRAILQEESIPPQEQAVVERQQEESVPPVPSSSEIPEAPPAIEPTAAEVICSQPIENISQQLNQSKEKLVQLISPRKEAKKEELESLGR
ncbi:hypothetical protein OROHE_009445 [Orobanche hederae]